jgi:hypothetical protein
VRASGRAESHAYAREVKLTARGQKKRLDTHIPIPSDAVEAFGRRGMIPVAGLIAFRSSSRLE